MHISPISCYLNGSVSFKQKNDAFYSDLTDAFKPLQSANDDTDYIEMGIDGNIGSKYIRDYIRENIFINQTKFHPEINIERMDDDEIKKYINKLDELTSKDVKLSNFHQLGENCFRGGALYTSVDDMKKLKSRGVNQVIDLAAAKNPEYEKACESNGLKYFYFPPFMNHNGARTYIDYVGESLYTMNNLGYSQEELLDFKKNSKSLFQIESRDFIEKMITLFDVINQGNFYMGCRFGTDVTEETLILNDYLNPQWTGEPMSSGEGGHLAVIKRIADIYKNLTEDDKIRLGFTTEFENKLKQKLGMKISKNIYVRS